MTYLCFLISHPRTFHMWLQPPTSWNCSYPFLPLFQIPSDFFFFLLRLFRFSATFDTVALSVFLKIFSSTRFYEPFYLGQRFLLGISCFSFLICTVKFASFKGQILDFLFTRYTLPLVNLSILLALNISRVKSTLLSKKRHIIS